MAAMDAEGQQDTHPDLAPRLLDALDQRLENELADCTGSGMTNGSGSQQLRLLPCTRLAVPPPT